MATWPLATWPLATWPRCLAALPGRAAWPRCLAVSRWPSAGGRQPVAVANGQGWYDGRGTIELRRE